MEETLTWDVLEYHEKDRTTDWYWTVGLVTLVAVGVSFYFQNYLFGILILIGVGTLAYLTIRKPQIITVQITDKGVEVRHELYPYKSLKAFWIEQDVPAEHDTHLLLLTSRLYLPMIAIPIGDVAPEKIRELLQDKVEEKELVENPYHRFLEILGF